MRGENDREAIRQLIADSLGAASVARSATPWPNERFDIDHQELVEVAEAFEAAFGCSARFSFKRRGDHGAELARILRRLDRYSGAGWKRGAGVAVLCRFLYVAGGLYEPGHVHSLAYFLPHFEELSKEVRRHWKLTWAPRWGMPTGRIYGTGKLGYDPKAVRASIEAQKRRRSRPR